MGNYKHQKLYEVQNAGDGEDKISNLPDCILHHILSFIPTKDAVATCILSTRWKYLWTSVPNIDFDDSLLYSSSVSGWCPIGVTCFMNFVERVLLLRDVSAMKKFRLSCRVCFNASCVHVWVSAAIMHNVQELELCLFVDKTFMLPRCVFDSKSLTAVKIEMNCILQLPNRISFPCLKTLHLCLVTFANDNLTQKLFSSCPVLQELALLDCEWINLKCITISIPTLKNLIIDDLPYFGSTDDLHGCQIKIDAINLISLNYIGYLSNEISLNNLASLATASVHIPILHGRQKEISYRSIELLKGLCSARTARIFNGTIKSLFLADNLLDHLPVFQNLTHLELYPEIENHTVEPLMVLLQYLPNLESICFSEGLDQCIFLGEDDWILKLVPICFSSCLKTVNLQNFHGNDREICFLKFLLKSALVLERMNIFYSKYPAGDPKKQKEIMNQLQVLPRGSTNCVITFL